MGVNRYRAYRYHSRCSYAVNACMISDEGGWLYRRFEDGLEQVTRSADQTRAGVWPPKYYIERVNAKRSRRKGWVIVEREEMYATTKLYPPKVCGPFETLDGAKAAYQMLEAADNGR